MVVLDRVSAKNDAQVSLQSMHRSPVAEVFGGVRHQEADRQDEELLPAWLANARNGKRDHRQRAQGGERKMHPSRVPGSDALGSVLRSKLVGIRGCANHFVVPTRNMPGAGPPVDRVTGLPHCCRSTAELSFLPSRVVGRVPSSIRKETGCTRDGAG